MIVNVGGRTDIVNYYSQWLMNRIKEGFAYSRNPLFPKNVSKISLNPKDVDCLMFCSKNYKPILKYMKEINEKYKIICHYTITAYGKDVEPYVPVINESIKNLIELSKIVGKEKVLWRYDPILLTEKYTVEKHLETFEYMAKQIAPYVQRGIFSFVEMYKKLDYNMPEIIPFTEVDKIKIFKGIGEISKKYNLYIQTCGTDENYEEYGIHVSGCTTSEILEQANSVKYKNVKAKPMRKGCHCIPSRDIGAYDTCLNGCKYCYANKRPDLAKENVKLHDKNSPLLLGNIRENDKITDAKQDSFIVKESGEQISFI
jgi:DNA repair photolyase